MRAPRLVAIALAVLGVVCTALFMPARPQLVSSVRVRAELVDPRKIIRPGVQPTTTLLTIPPTTSTTARPLPRPAPAGSKVTTSTTQRTATTQASPVPVPGGIVDPACLTGTRKTHAESDRCWRPLVDDYPWSVTLALRIVWCESAGDESAVNSIGATGLFQLYDGTPDGAPYPGGLDPTTNVRLAYEVKYLTGLVGFVQDWASSIRCWG